MSYRAIDGASLPVAVGPDAAARRDRRSRRYRRRLNGFAGGSLGLVVRTLGALGTAVALAVFVPNGQAATNVSGTIAADTQWRAQDGPFEVVGDVTVSNGATLSIEAGTAVFMAAGASLTVEQGALRAVGRGDAPVIITSYRDRAGDTPAPGDWNQLRFLDGTVDSQTLLEHVQIRYGRGLALQAAAPTFNYVVIADHAAAAVTIDLRSSPAGVGNRAQNNVLNGILVPPGDITQTVRWSLKGIPFVIPGGTVGVGAPPAVTGLVPAEIEQGGTTQATVSGTRLSGAESLRVLRAGVQAQVLPGGSDTAIPVRLTAQPGAALGPAGIEVQVAAGAAILDPALTVVVPLPPLTVSARTPDSLRRGESRAFTVSGDNLLGAAVSVAAGSGLTVSNVESTDVQLSFTLAASTDASLGTAVLTLANPGVAKGQARLDITVRKALPKIVVTPTVLAVPPDSVTRQFRVGLSDTDDEDHVLTLVLGNAAIAAITPLSVTIPAGENQAAVSIRGLTQGQSSLTIGSAGLATVSAVVYISPQFESINTAYGPSVGVERPPATGTEQPQAVGPLASPAIGVVSSRYVTELVPDTLSVGTGPVNLVVRGVGLEAVTGISIVPGTGLTLGTINVAPDGSTVTVPVTVAAGSPATLRQVVLAGAHAPYSVVRPEADRLRIALAAPQIESVEPILLAQGSTVTMTIRGRNLSAVRAVTVTPAAGILMDDSPSVDTSGTSLNVRISAAATAAPGDRIVGVTTAGGAAAAMPGPANTLRIVAAGQPLGQIAGLRAANVGVAKDAPAQPPSTSVALVTPLVGVNVGPVIASRTPASGAVGERVTLMLRGTALAAVTGVEMVPGTGLSVGAPEIGADGTAVTVAVDIALDSPLTTRTLRVRAGAAEVPFSDPAQTQFRVTLPQPRIESVTPNLIAIGATTRMTVRGANFPGASVRLAPPDDVSVSSSVNLVSPNEMTVDVTVAAGASAGTRVLIVATAAGETTANADASNTVTLATTISAPITPLSSASVGVEKAAEIAPTTRDADQLAAQQVGIVVGPVVLSVEAPQLKPLTSGIVTVRGVGLDRISQVRLNGAGGVTISGDFQVNGDGTQLTVAITVDGDPGGGLRQLELLDANGSAIPFADPLAAALQIQPGQRFSLFGSNVGVTREPAGGTSSQAALSLGAPVGIAVGPIGRGIEPPPLYPGATGTLIITGVGLDAVNAVSFTGPTGLAVDAPQVSADGSELRAAITVAADAAPGLRGVVLNGASASVPFVDVRSAQIRVASGQPTIESIDPIFWTIGDTFTLTVRGQHLGQALAVRAVNAPSVQLADGVSVSADGTSLTVRVYVPPETAPTDQGYVQVITPGGASSATRSFADGFSIVR